MMAHACSGRGWSDFVIPAFREGPTAHVNEPRAMTALGTGF